MMILDYYDDFRQFYLEIIQHVLSFWILSFVEVQMEHRYSIQMIIESISITFIWQLKKWTFQILVTHVILNI